MLYIGSTYSVTISCVQGPHTVLPSLVYRVHIQCYHLLCTGFTYSVTISCVQGPHTVLPSLVYRVHIQCYHLLCTGFTYSVTISCVQGPHTVLPSLVYRVHIRTVLPSLVYRVHIQCYHLLCTGLTPRDLAMDCDFYECADLIDDLEKLKIKQEEDFLREERLSSECCVPVSVHSVHCVCRFVWSM